MYSYQNGINNFSITNTNENKTVHFSSVDTVGIFQKEECSKGFVYPKLSDEVLDILKNSK